MIKRLTQRLKVRIQDLTPGRGSLEFKRAFRNAMMNSGEGLLAPLLWLISTPIFVGYLGDDQFGIWMLVNGFIGVGGVLSFGLTEATIKFVSKYRALEDMRGIARIVRGTLLVYALLGILGAILAAGLAPVLGAWIFNSSEGNETLGLAALRLGGLGIFLRFLDNVVQSVLQGFERYDLNSKVGMFVNASTVLTNVILVMLGFGLITLLWVMLGFIFLGTLLKAVIIRRAVMPSISFWPACDRATFGELLSFGFYNWIQHALSLINGNLDRFLIAGFLSPAAVTYYSVCYHLITQIHFVLMRAAAFLFPMVSSLFEKGDLIRLKRLYHKSTVLIAVVSVALVIPFFILGDSILRVWMGPEFADQATVILRIFCVRMAFIPIGIVNYYFLLGSGLVKLQATIVCVAAPISLLGMFLLIPKYGAVGAAVAQLLSLPLTVGSRILIEKRLFHEFSPHRNLAYLFPAILLFFCAALVVFYMPVDLSSLLGVALWFGALSILSGGIAYVISQWAQKIRWSNRSAS